MKEFSCRCPKCSSSISIKVSGFGEPIVCSTCGFALNVKNDKQDKNEEQNLFNVQMGDHLKKTEIMSHSEILHHFEQLQAMPEDVSERKALNLKSSLIFGGSVILGLLSFILVFVYVLDGKKSKISTSKTKNNKKDNIVASKTMERKYLRKTKTHETPFLEITLYSGSWDSYKLFIRKSITKNELVKNNGQWNAQAKIGLNLGIVKPEIGGGYKSPSQKSTKSSSSENHLLPNLNLKAYAHIHGSGHTEFDTFAVPEHAATWNYKFFLDTIEYNSDDFISFQIKAFFQGREILIGSKNIKLEKLLQETGEREFKFKDGSLNVYVRKVKRGSVSFEFLKDRVYWNNRKMYMSHEFKYSKFIPNSKRLKGGLYFRKIVWKKFVDYKRRITCFRAFRRFLMRKIGQSKQFDMRHEISVSFSKWKGFFWLHYDIETFYPSGAPLTDPGNEYAKSKKCENWEGYGVGTIMTETNVPDGALKALQGRWEK